MKLLQMPARISVVVSASRDESPDIEEKSCDEVLPAEADFDGRAPWRELDQECSPWAIYRNHTVVLLRSISECRWRLVECLRCLGENSSARK